MAVASSAGSMRLGDVLFVAGALATASCGVPSSAGSPYVTVDLDAGLSSGSASSSSSSSSSSSGGAVGGGSSSGGGDAVGDAGAGPGEAEGSTDASGGRTGGFVHPGVGVDKGMLDFVKTKIAGGSDPWKSALAGAGASTYGRIGYTPAPLADVVCGSYSNPDIGCTAEKADAAAAYTHA